MMGAETKGLTQRKESSASIPISHTVGSKFFVTYQAEVYCAQVR